MVERQILVPVLLERLDRIIQLLLEIPFGSAMGRRTPLTCIRAALVQRVIKAHHLRNDLAYPLRRLDDVAVGESDQKQFSIAWKIRREMVASERVGDEIDAPPSLLSPPKDP